MVATRSVPAVARDESEDHGEQRAGEDARDGDTADSVQPCRRRAYPGQGGDDESEPESRQPLEHTGEQRRGGLRGEVVVGGAGRDPR